MTMEMSRFRRVLVIGLGSSGLAAARLASEDGAEVWVSDRRSEQELAAVVGRLPSRARTFLGGHPAECLEGVDLVITSPGVPPGTDILARARDLGVTVLTEVEFAWHHAPSAPLVAVTGSNGKSTVTTLIAHMLTASGQRAAAGGNLGPAASDLVLEGGWGCWVLEVSSFQTELFTELRPDVGVFLNLSQDHLERHPDMASYRDAKRRLFEFQTSSDVAVLNADEPAVAETPTRARRRLFSIEGRADGWLDGDTLAVDRQPVLSRGELALAGIHNVANALASILAAAEVGGTIEGARRVLTSFTGLEHRHLTVHEADGVRWVDDSKATNIGAALAALRGYPDRSVHLILGGQAKGQDFSVMVSEVGRAVVEVYLIGIDGPMIAEALEGATRITECGTLDEAVRRARRNARPGQWVVLAPACASFDQFTGYSERGRAFTEQARRAEAPCP
jgi:UDP-N-acetylmuramoylalanine--D-glutamate ligase